MIELRTLGGTGLRGDDGAELRPALAQPKRFGLLVYLALAGAAGFRRRDSLVALFWPELDDEHARGALRQSLSFLRRELGDGVVVTRGDEEVGVDASTLWCDAVAFEQACTSDPAHAVELYRGDLLVGFHVDDAAPEFERWLDEARADLRRRATACTWALARLRRDAGARADASALAHRAASLAPDDEAQWRAVLALLDELGDRAGALMAYEVLAARLREDHDAEPAPETQALMQRIRARTTSAADAMATVAAPTVPTLPTERDDDAPAEAPRATPPTRAWWSSRRGRIVLVAALVAVVVGVGVARTMLAHRAVVPPERTAHDLYVRGRYWWNKRGAGLLTSIDFFNKSLDADPTFAPAYSGLGDAYVQLGYGSLLRPDDAFPKARAAAQRALELDSTLAEPHATLGYVKLYYEWDWPAAEREFRRAIALEPGYATAHEWYGVYLAAMGRFDEAIAEERRAEALDPLSTAGAATSAWVEYYAGRYDAADRELHVVLRENASFALGHFYMGRLHEARGEMDAALGEYGATGPLQRWVPTIAARGRVLALAGHADEARASIAAMDSMARHEYVTAYAVALVYAALGQRDSAFTWLDRGVAERTHWLVWLNRDPRWSTIRGDARFAALVKKVGLPP